MRKAAAKDIMAGPSCPLRRSSTAWVAGLSYLLLHSRPASLGRHSSGA
jgi:hypothetical protein